MDSLITKCSTPEYGRNNPELNLNLSEIRRYQYADSLSKLKNKSEQKIVPKNHSESRETFSHDSSSDSHYVTLDTFEIDCQESEDAVIDSSENNNRQSIFNFSENVTDFGTTDHLVLYPKIFSSPSDYNVDKHYALHLASQRDDTHDTILSDPIISSPAVFQKTHRYPENLKTYPLHGAKNKEKLTPSKISFSPKWVNKVPPKYSLPSDIPSRNKTLSAVEDKSRSGLSNRASSYVAQCLWEDLNKDTIQIGKTFPVIEKGTSSEKFIKKYSHLRVNEEKFKRFRSPTKKIDSSADKENVSEKRIVGERKKGARISKKPLMEHRPRISNATFIEARDDEQQN